MKKPLLTVLAAIVLLFIGCKKYHYDPNPELPPITQSGANTFGCIIDGKVFIPQGDTQSFCLSGCGTTPLNFSYSPLNQAYGSSKNTFYIFTYADNPNEGSTPNLTLTVNGIAIATGKTIALKADSVVGASATYGDLSKNKSYRTSNSATGELYISKLDSIHKFVSGTFKFKAVSYNNKNDTTRVTDGRFDIHYQ